MITNYTTLQSAVADWLNRDDLTATIPTFIQLAEDQLRTRLRGAHVETVTYGITKGEVPLPGDVSVVESIHLVTVTGSRRNLFATDLAGVWSARGDGTASVPVCYSVVQDEVWFGPVPDQAYTGTLVYEPFLALSSTQATNWALTASPSAYLYGALVAAAPYLKDDARMPLWQQAFDRAVGDLKLHAQQQRFGGPLIQQPAVRY